VRACVGHEGVIAAPHELTVVGAPRQTLSTTMLCDSPGDRKTMAGVLVAEPFESLPKNLEMEYAELKKTLAQHSQWEYLEGGVWKPYNVDDNALLERLHVNFTDLKVNDPALYGDGSDEGNEETKSSSTPRSGAGGPAGAGSGTQPASGAQLVRLSNGNLLSFVDNLEFVRGTTSSREIRRSQKKL